MGMCKTPEKKEYIVRRKRAKDRTMDKAVSTFKGWLVRELGGNQESMACQQIKAEFQEEST